MFSLTIQDIWVFLEQFEFKHPYSNAKVQMRNIKTMSVIFLLLNSE